jgi:SAM-dependent methyltransferase
MSPRSELISLLRGFFACPVLAALADLGLAQRMRAGPFTPADLPVANRPALLAALRYLQSLGVIEATTGDEFRATPTGEYVLDRTGAFHLLRSYRDYFADFAGLLSTPEGGAAVRRLENIGGTGRLHARKYFPSALRWLAGKAVRCVVDVGCGNGEFLASVLAAHPVATGVGVDLSAEAVAATCGRLGERVRGVVADAATVADWADAIPDGGRGVVVAIWFVLHEFAGSDPERIAGFFRELHARLPLAEVIVGEVVAVPPEALAGVRAKSVYPELLLFHALSGQGVLTWDRHREWLRQVPYRTAGEERFDEVQTLTGTVPSTIGWYLLPERAEPVAGKEKTAILELGNRGE